MPEIFQHQHIAEYLSDDAQAASQLELRTERAEMYVVSRYREEAALADSSMYFDDPLGAETSPGIVQLRGWAETDDGEPDPSAMSGDLLHRLRMVIASVVEWRVKHEDTELIESESKGSVSVSYSDAPDLPTRLFDPLEKYDERHPFSGRW